MHTLSVDSIQGILYVRFIISKNLHNGAREGGVLYKNKQFRKNIANKFVYIIYFP